LNALTVKLQAAVLPAISVAVQVTVVVPAGKHEPEEGLQTTVAWQLALTNGAKFTTEQADGGQTLAAVTAVTFAGHVIIGVWQNSWNTCSPPFAVSPTSSELGWLGP